MLKSEFLKRLAVLHPELEPSDVKLAVNLMLGSMADSLADGRRIEIRGFGSFSVRRRAPRMGWNPRVGRSVLVGRSIVIRFKPGVELRARVKRQAGARAGILAVRRVRGVLGKNGQLAARAVPDPAAEAV